MRAALALLTRLPVGVPDGATMTGAPAFPFVGALLGLAMAGVLVLVGDRAPVLAALAAVGTGVVLTGALHLDGLADTADALAAQNPERAEAARTDPSSGPGGVTAIVLAVGIEVAALADLVAREPAYAAAVLVANAAVARALVVVVAALIRDPGGPGFGAWFIRAVGPPDAVLAAAGAVLVVAAAVAASDVRVAVTAGVGAAVGAAALAWLVRRRGTLDGDAMGAGIVVSGLAGLAAAALLR